MSLKITVVDEQTGETESRRIAEGDYAVITAHPCIVDSFNINGTRVNIRIMNYAPAKLKEYEVILAEDNNGSF